jgi:ABC-type multidrug transport system fused ATPase/permease subunit
MDIVISTTTLTLILTQPSISGAAAGFMLVFAGDITWNVNWLLSHIRTMELKGVSLERTAEYRHLPREESDRLDPNKPGYFDEQASPYGLWPEHGTIEVEDLCARYGPDMPDILHGITFSIKAGERVGIVGATGGGKSTLAKAFFSFVDITQGKIKIDGRDISEMPLSVVRSKLGIIAQDPILLSGTLRLNLDIEGKYTDDQLYDALHQVQLLKPKTSYTTLGYQSNNTDPVAKSRASVQSDESATIIGNHSTIDGGQTNIFANLDSEIKTGGEK